RNPARQEISNDLDHQVPLSALAGTIDDPGIENDYRIAGSKSLSGFHASQELAVLVRMPFATPQPGALAGAGKRGRTECEERRGIEKDLGFRFSGGAQNITKAIQIHSIVLAFVPLPG